MHKVIYKSTINTVLKMLVAKSSLFLVCINVLSLSLFSQDPTCFSITSENGLPSNEVYSMVQDKQGFIWFGCDAGIYKYDGVKCTQYKSKDQRSRAFSGLSLSSTGKVFAYNFNGQIFYVDKDSLYCLNSWNGKLSNIICDNNANLWVCGDNGLHQYNEKTKKWKCFNDFDGDGKADEQAFTRSCEIKGNAVYFICSSGIGILERGYLRVVPFVYPDNTVCGEYELAVGKNYTWLFHRSKALFYRLANNKIERFESPYLSNALGASKFNDLREFTDGKLYIPTYSGLIIYNPETDTGAIMYRNKAISYVLIDRENNYWLSTLQSGLMRIPNLGIKVWKLDHNDESSKKVNKIVSVNEGIYATNISGQVAFLNTQLNEMKVY